MRQSVVRRAYDDFNEWLALGARTRFNGFNPTPFINQRPWFVDYNNGDNHNDGKTAQTAVATVAEIRRRWNGGIKGVRPQLPSIAVTVRVTGSPAAPFSDPISVICDIDAQPGFSMLIDFQTSVKRSGTITTVPNAFARTATGQQTITDAGVVSWTSDLDQPLLDTTTNAFAWVVGGGSPATLSAAYQAVGNGSTPTPDNIVQLIENTGLNGAAIGPGNAYEVLTLPDAYFGTGVDFRVAPGGVDPTATSLATITIRRAHGLSQGTTDECHYNGTASFRGVTGQGACIVFVECSCDQQRRTQGGVIWANCASSVVGIPSGFFDILVGTNDAAALLAGYARHEISLGAGFQVDQDHAILGAFVYGTNATAPGSGNIILALAARYLMGGAATPALFHFIGNISVVPNYEGSTSVFYGTTSGDQIASLGGSAPEFGAGAALTATKSAAVSFVFDGGAAATFSMDSQANGVAFNVATGAFVPGLRAVTVQSLDASIVGGGFAGSALWPPTQNAIVVHN